MNKTIERYDKKIVVVNHIFAIGNYNLYLFVLLMLLRIRDYRARFSFEVNFFSCFSAGIKIYKRQFDDYLEESSV